MWLERLVLAEIVPGRVVLLDPDGNQNVQRLDTPELNDICVVPLRGGRAPGIAAAERIKGFDAPVVGHALTDVLVSGEHIAVERRALAAAHDEEVAGLRLKIEEAKKTDKAPPAKPPATPEPDDGGASDSPDSPPKGGSKKDGGVEGSWIIAENRDGMPFGNEAATAPKAKLARRAHLWQDRRASSGRVGFGGGAHGLGQRAQAWWR